MIVDTVYAFQYNDCVFESSFHTISLHSSPKGAYKALRQFLEESYEQWRKDGLLYGKQYHKFGKYEAWRIEKMYILE